MITEPTFERSPPQRGQLTPSTRMRCDTRAARLLLLIPSMWRVLILWVIAGGCGHHDGGVDAPASTACGSQGLRCDYATQICVVQTPVGPGETYTRVSIPAACRSDRSCGCAGSTLCS